MKELTYFIDPTKSSIKEIEEQLRNADEIKFVSLAGVDLGNHTTDERIPKGLVLENLEDFLATGIQTDGSSVFLPIIAELDDAKVDILPDKNIKWFVDYNYSNGTPTGTLVIPSYLRHSNQLVGSRSILKNTTKYIKKEILQLLEDENAIKNIPIDSVEEVEDVVLTSATELEFWVKTPDHRSDIEKLSASQEMKEHYWKRTVGQVRTAVEESVLKLEAYGLRPEMAHKEVGGVKAKLTGTNEYSAIMEQIEIDWEYDHALQSADNEMIAKNIIQDTFETQGLEVTFKAKPREGIAGNGEHTHVSISLKLKDGSYVNLFSHKDHDKNYMSEFGWGALYSLIHNYEAINPFVTSTTNAFKRLQPGYEAPVSTVASIGNSPEMPSRNRTVLAGLIRDLNNPMATRFELRAPNPETNTYLVTSVIYIAMLEGIKAAINSGKSPKELCENFTAEKGVEKFYLDQERLYSTEKDVFDDFTQEEREACFGKSPRTVYENLLALTKEENIDLLSQGNIFSETLIKSYYESMLHQWTKELETRLTSKTLKLVRRYKRLHGKDDLTDLDILNWETVNKTRHELVKDSVTQKSLVSKLKDALEKKDYELASKLQLEIDNKIKVLTNQYIEYKNNIIDFK